MKFWQVDSFTNQIFKGNPAGVVYLTEDISAQLKQQIAMELNLSETAFVYRAPDGLQISWFTPNAEVNLCGHATLAAAHVLWSENLWTAKEISFQSKSGPLPVYRNGELYTLDFPLQPPVATSERLTSLSALLDSKVTYAGSNQEDALAVLADPKALRSCQPDLSKVATLPERGLIITAKSDLDDYDFIYRAFYPKLAIPEDPVTGSANTLLTPYWAQQLGRQKLRAYQASQRGGELQLELKNSRVHISGQAVTSAVGELFI